MTSDAARPLPFLALGLPLGPARFDDEVEPLAAPLTEDDALAPAVELTAYRLVQEAITNLSKHAEATSVWLELAPVDGRVEISVRDDGKGFNSGMAHTSAYGLVGMRYRVEAEGGSLTVVSAPGHGTLIRASLPAQALGCQSTKA